MSPHYDVLEKENGFELRKYSQFYIVAYDNRNEIWVRVTEA